MIPSSGGAGDGEFWDSSMGRWGTKRGSGLFTVERRGVLNAAGIGPRPLFLPHIFHDTTLQRAILSDSSREEIVQWLVWNDPNGTYSDADSELEDRPCLTLEAARKSSRKW